MALDNTNNTSNNMDASTTSTPTAASTVATLDTAITNIINDNTNSGDTANTTIQRESRIEATNSLSHDTQPRNSANGPSVSNSTSANSSNSSSPRSVVRKRQRFTSTRVASTTDGSRNAGIGSSSAIVSATASPIPPISSVDLLTSVASDFHCIFERTAGLHDTTDEREPRGRIKYDLLSQNDYTREEIDDLLSTLQAKKRKLEATDQQVELEALKELNLQIQCLDNDMRKAQEKLEALKQYNEYQTSQSLEEEDDDQLECIGGSGGVQVPNEVSEEEDEAVPPQAGSKRSHSHLERDEKNDGNSGKLASEASLQSLKIAKQVNVNKKRVATHFEDLQRCYFDVSLNQSTRRESALSSFCSTISKFTKFSHFEHVNTLRYGDIFNTSSIVSSIEFDRDDEYFATAGVTKKIKIFEYGCIEKTGLAGTSLREDDRSEMYEGGDLARPSRYSSNKKPITSVLHYPVREMMCRSKISCLSWNSYIKSQIASSDYEGIVSLWDAQTGINTLNYDEHEKRAWSVDFSRTDPTRLASGSDDTKVKIWSTTHKASVCTIESKANICCVKFNPESSHHIAFGSADHHIHYYDLRKANEPLYVFKGHRKAVSYVKFLGRDELVSASTDSTLKLWNTLRMNCARTYTGHVNEKNFVGLSASGDWISCGSENNAVYTYYKELRDPVVTVKFGNSNPVTGEDTTDEDPSQFVSSVCWKKNTSNNILLAANSSGVIKVLELV
ncbi:coatomer subunit alpha [Mortierella sp. AM989]|nr:coatomer subunit alpha [Mortierella sp. AM989]